jgi:signal transduction histidine kinase
LLSLAFTFYYLEREIKRSVDTQLETMASSIFASGLSVDLMDKIDDVDDMLSDLFEEERVDRYIRIYQVDGLKLLYANEFGKMVSLPLPEGRKLSTIEYGNRKFRVLEVKNGPILLQVALIMDSFLSRMKILEKHILAFSSGLMLIILLITALSLKALLRPLKVLGQDFAHWSDRLTFDFMPMKASTDQLLLRIQERQAEWKSGEMHDFLKQLYAFAENLSKFLQFSQNQYSVLAHELKTPLTIMRNDLEVIKGKYQVADLGSEISKVTTEIDELSKLIRNFLDWSQQAASVSKPEELYAVKLGSVVLEEIRRLQTLFHNKIHFENSVELQVFCSQIHAHQLVANLVQNALVHGPQNSLVKVRLTKSTLEVEDTGSGLADEVFQNLGAPFNRSLKSHGHGLGLAWIKTICDIYGWKLEFQKLESRHIVRIKFESEA